jgi:hypothetical protein
LPKNLLIFFLIGKCCVYHGVHCFFLKANGHTVDR